MHIQTLIRFVRPVITSPRMRKDECMIVYPTETPKATDISAVIDFALSYNPLLAARDISTITWWVASGCDIEKDILPAMKKICEWKKGVSSFNYFTKPICAARDLRKAKEKIESEKLPVDSQRLIEIYQWKRKMGMPLTTEQQEALAKHEASVNA